MRVFFVVGFNLPPHATSFAASEYVRNALTLHCATLIPFTPAATMQNEDGSTRYLTGSAGHPMFHLDTRTISVEPAKPAPPPKAMQIHDKWTCNRCKAWSLTLRTNGVARAPLVCPFCSDHITGFTHGGETLKMADIVLEGAPGEK